MQRLAGHRARLSHKAYNAPTRELFNIEPILYRSKSPQKAKNLYSEMNQTSVRWMHDRLMWNNATPSCYVIKVDGTHRIWFVGNFSNKRDFHQESRVTPTIGYSSSIFRMRNGEREKMMHRRLCIWKAQIYRMKDWLCQIIRLAPTSE